MFPRGLSECVGTSGGPFGHEDVPESLWGLGSAQWGGRQPLGRELSLCFVDSGHGQATASALSFPLPALRTAVKERGWSGHPLVPMAGPLSGTGSARREAAEGSEFDWELSG